MTVRRRTALTLMPALVGAGSLVAALLPMTSAQAEPAPAPASEVSAAEDEPIAPVGPIAGSMTITMNRDFVRQLRSTGVRIEGVGSTVVAGRTITVPVWAPSARPGEVVLFTDGIALRKAEGRQFRCTSLALIRSTGELLCGRGDRSSSRFSTTRLFATEENIVTPDTQPTDQIRSAVTLGRASALARVNRKLGVNVLRPGAAVGTVALTLGDAPPRAAKDSRSGCDIDDWARDTSINRGWAVQAMVNRIPKNVSISQFNAVTGTAAVPTAAPVAIGQRTPFMEGVSVKDAKRIIRGSYYDTDNFWSGPSYGCHTLAPFLVGQGGLDEAGVQAWNYDGDLRTPQNSQRARTQWWGHARQDNYNGATGQYTWTCRGVPTGTDDAYWARVSNGTGFFGDGSDRTKPNAGRAPECADENMGGFTLTTRYSISKRGALEARDNQSEYPRFCSVTGNDLVGCWQEIYPLEWDRAWGFQNHVYASALRAVLDSDTRIRLPNEFSDTPGTVRPLAWRISDADVSGAWPVFTGADGVRRDMSGVATPLNNQSLATPSPFTVPAGLKDTFTLAGYGTPMGNQQMTFLLTGDTDGTWAWPTSNVDGRTLPRPQVRITVNFTISNFDNGGSCSKGYWYDDKAFGNGRGNDKAGPHCIQGQVPTIWPLPTSSSKLWEREIDEFVTDKDGKRTRNSPTTDFEATVLASCYKKDELVIQNNSLKTAPVIGADFTWNIRLSGTLTQLNSC